MRTRSGRRGDASHLPMHGTGGGTLRLLRAVGSDPIDQTLHRLRPEDLEPVWRSVDSLERAGWIRGEKASRWKDAIVERMETLGLDTHELSWSAPPDSRMRDRLPS